MKAPLIMGIFASGFLVLLGASVGIGWYYAYGEEAVFTSMPETSATKLSEISDPQKMEAAIQILLKQNHEMSESFSDILGDFIRVYVITCIVSAIFIWICLLSAVKERRKEKGIALGWLRWF